MDAADWDARYAASELVWSAGPNQFLVEYAADLPAGRALDLGAGEGRNALWLAEQGWDVTAVDFSRAGLEKGREIAARRGVDVGWIVGDATSWQPPQQAFQLVIVFYLQLRASQRRAALRSAATAVAAGGQLLVVGHDRDNLAMGVGGPSDPGVLLTVTDVTDDLVGTGLVVAEAQQVQRTVADADHPGVAIDCLVRAERPLLGGYRLEFEDTFEGTALDVTKWVPAHLPHWSSRRQAAAQYRFDDPGLVLQITHDQQPWCPEFDGDTRTSSLQTGVCSGPVGSGIGQHRFTDAAVVREEQPATRLYTPHHGLFEVRCRALADPAAMVAFWMIGFEDRPERSGEICICEIFGRDVSPGLAHVGMGVHPFGDPDLVDDFVRVPLTVDATQMHTYAAEWTPAYVSFFVDGRRVRTVVQSPDYPMQFMLGIYEFDGTSTRAAGGGSYPKEFGVDFVRGYRREQMGRKA